ncbi:MAG: hypothetical protein O2894_06125 [Planctomycetota bacterium]|nr:hypothetical protein [Planctomycetota bacterium]
MFGLTLVCMLTGCGADPTSAGAASGRYALDRAEYARRLIAERLESKPAEAELDGIRAACVARARALMLDLELRPDGAFLARFMDGEQEQRLAGQWEQDGALVSFHTTQAPDGRVTTMASVYATYGSDGLEFKRDTTGFSVPHGFLLRRRE